MNLAMAPYLFTLYISVSVCWFLAFYAWRRREMTTAAIPFAATIFSAGFWALLYGLELITPTLPGKLFWFNIKQLGASFIAPSLLLTALQYTGLRVRFPRLLYAVLLFEPFFSQLIFWTNGLHGLGGTPILLRDVLPFPVLYFEFGPWFWFSIFVGFLLLLVTVFIFIAQIPGANQLYRKQLTLLLLGLFPPWIVGTLGLFGLGSLEYFDVITFIFPISGLFFALGIFRYRLLRLMPVAHTAVFSSIRDGIIIVDDEFNIIEMNSAALRLLGQRERNLLGQHVSEVFPVWDPAILTEAHFDDSQTLEFYYEQGGQYRYLEMHGAAIFSNIYQVSGHVLILYDVTERKLAEIARQISDNRYRSILEAAVRSEQERSAIILQSVNDAIAVSDLDYKVTYVNRAFTQLTGYQFKEAVDKPANFIVYGRIPQPAWEQISHALRAQTVWEGELQFLRKNGVVYDAAVLIAPMRDGDGQLIGYVSSHRDITQAKHLEETRRHFITNVSHELRTPVTNLKLYADLLQRNFDTSRKEDYFTTLNDQIERLEAIIQNTLDLTSLEDNGKQLQKQPVSWVKLSQDLQARFQARAEEKQISLHFSPRLPDLPPIQGDSQRIFQALHELIQNAITFSKIGGEVTVDGKVQKEKSKQWLTLWVTDTGHGIAENEQGHIFDRFYRGETAAAGHIPGTGLGLSMIKLIMQAHDGRVTVESNLEQGSTFTLWFPLNEIS